MKRCNLTLNCFLSGLDSCQVTDIHTENGELAVEGIDRSNLCVCLSQYDVMPHQDKDIMTSAMDEGHWFTMTYGAILHTRASSFLTDIVSCPRLWISCNWQSVCDQYLFRVISSSWLISLALWSMNRSLVISARWQRCIQKVLTCEAHEITKTVDSRRTIKSWLAVQFFGHKSLRSHRNIPYTKKKLLYWCTVLKKRKLTARDL